VRIPAIRAYYRQKLAYLCLHGFSGPFRPKMVVLRGKGISHMIWRMCSGCKRIVIGILWELPDSCRIFKLGREIDHVTRHVCPLTKVKRLKVKVTRSRNISAGITLKVVVQCWPPKNSFLLFGVVTLLPLWAKINQEVQPWETESAGRETDTRCEKDKLILQFLPRYMLYL